MELCIENMVVDEGDEMILPMSVEYRNDITQDDLIELCRLCGNCSNQLMPIFTGDGAEHRLPEKIGEHLPIIKVSINFNTNNLARCIKSNILPRK